MNHAVFQTRKIGALCILLLLLFLYIQEFTIFDNSFQPTISGGEQNINFVATESGQIHPASVTVVDVVDGDTFKVAMADRIETIRLVGINTPETVDPRKPVECFGVAASNELKQFLHGRRVFLTPDSTQSDRDRYGRLLRFAQLESGEDVGLHMIKLGYAEESLYSEIPHSKQQQYVEAERTAQEAKLGLWSDHACSEAPLPESQSTQERSCTGPDLDCVNFKTRADAQEFFQKCGFTALFDPMQLDGIKVDDGVACEGLP